MKRAPRPCTRRRQPCPAARPLRHTRDLLVGRAERTDVALLGMPRPSSASRRRRTPVTTRAPAGQAAEHRRRFAVVARLAERRAVEVDTGVRRKHPGVRMPEQRTRRLFRRPGGPPTTPPFRREHLFRDAGGRDGEGDSEGAQDLRSPRRRGSENERRGWTHERRVLRVSRGTGSRVRGADSLLTGGKEEVRAAGAGAREGIRRAVER